MVSSTSLLFELHERRFKTNAFIVGHAQFQIQSIVDAFKSIRNEARLKYIKRPILSHLLRGFYSH